MAAPDWFTTTEWDILYLGGAAVPCAFAQVEVKLPSGLDVKKGKGKKKATITDDGDPPAQVKLRIFLLPRHVPDFQQKTIPILRPGGKSTSRPPLEIAHPNTALWGISVITPGEVSSPMPARGGMLVVEVDSTEWCPAPAAVKKASKKPKDAEDRADWSRFLPDLPAGVARFVRGVVGGEPPKPSSEAAKKL